MRPLLLIALAHLLLVPAATADIWQWTDPTGVVRYTPDPDRVPSDSRGTLVKVAPGMPSTTASAPTEDPAVLGPPDGLETDPFNAPQRARSVDVTEIPEPAWSVDAGPPDAAAAAAVGAAGAAGVPEATPPIPDTAARVPEAAAPVPEAAAPVAEAAPPIPETAARAPEAAPPIPETAARAPEAAPPIPETATQSLEAPTPASAEATGSSGATAAAVASTAAAVSAPPPPVPTAAAAAPPATAASGSPTPTEASTSAATTRIDPGATEASTVADGAADTTLADTAAATTVAAASAPRVDPWSAVATAGATAPPPSGPTEVSLTEEQISRRDELEELIARDEEALKKLLSDTSLDTAGFEENPELREIAMRLPALQAELKALKEGWTPEAIEAP